MSNVFYLCTYIIGMICIIGMTLCFFYLRRRTEYGKQLFRKIVALRNFILTADKDKLETLFADAEKDTRASLNALKEYLSK